MPIRSVSFDPSSGRMSADLELRLPRAAEFVNMMIGFTTSSQLNVENLQGVEAHASNIEVPHVEDVREPEDRFKPGRVIDLD